MKEICSNLKAWISERKYYWFLNVMAIEISLIHLGLFPSLLKVESMGNVYIWPVFSFLEYLDRVEALGLTDRHLSVLLSLQHEHGGDVWVWWWEGGLRALLPCRWGWLLLVRGVLGLWGHGTCHLLVLDGVKRIDNSWHQLLRIMMVIDWIGARAWGSHAWMLKIGAYRARVLARTNLVPGASK